MTKAKTERKLQEQAELINNTVFEAAFRHEFQKENGISLDDAADALERQKAVVNKKITMYINEQYHKLNSLMNLVVGAANTIAGRAVIDTKNELYKRKDLWLHEIKYNATRAEKSYYEYENTQTEYFDTKKNLFRDYLSAIEENTAKDVKILQMSMLQVLTKKDQSDRVIKSQVETAYVLTEYACCVYDTIMKEAKKRTGFDYSPFFQKARLTSTFHYWKELSEIITKADKGSGTIDFNDDDNCRLAFQIIERKISGEDLPNKAGYEAMKLNMDLVGSEITLEDYQELADMFENKK